MLLSNLFNLPTFQAVQLTAVVERIAYQPSMLGAFGPALFTVSSSSTRQIAMAQSEGVLSLIPTSPIGAPPVELEKKPSDLRSFIIHRLAKGSTLMAESLTGLMLAPDFQQIAMVQQELANRSAKIRTDLEFTQEYMRLGAVLGMSARRRRLGARRLLAELGRPAPGVDRLSAQRPRRQSAHAVAAIDPRR